MTPRVDLHDDRELSVAKDLHGYAAMDIEVGEQGPTRPARIVNSDLAGARFRDPGVVGAIDVSGLHGRAVPGREDQRGPTPHIAVAAFHFLLLDLSLTQRGDTDVGQTIVKLAHDPQPRTHPALPSPQTCRTELRCRNPPLPQVIHGQAPLPTNGTDADRRTRPSTANKGD